VDSPEAFYIALIFGEVRGPKADDELEKQLDKHPDSGDLHALHAERLSRVGLQRRDGELLRRAAEANDRAVTLAPTDPDLLYGRSASRYHAWLYGGKDPNATAGIIEDLRAARAIRPLADYWTDCGKTYVVVMAQPAAAIPELEQAIALADTQGRLREQGRARAWLGVAYLLTDREERAVEIWLEGIRIAPQQTATYAFVAHLPKASATARRKILNAAPPQIRRQIEEALATGVRDR
jgi:tetratricopeptide (TPR) repeat protein